MKLLLDYAVALTNLNGVIDVEKVVEIYNSQNELHIDIKDVELLIDEHEEELKHHFVLTGEGYFSHNSIVNKDEVSALFEIKKDKPYYIPDQEELLRYKDADYYEKTEHTERLYQFLKNYVTTSESVEDAFYDVLVSCQMESRPMDIIHYLAQIDVIFPTRKELKEALEVIGNLANNTRLWSYNGFTPYELFEEYEKPKLNFFQRMILKFGNR